MFDRLAWRSEYDRYLGLNEEEEVDDEKAVAAGTANAAAANASPQTLSRPAP